MHSVLPNSFVRLLSLTLSHHFSRSSPPYPILLCFCTALHLLISPLQHLRSSPHVTSTESSKTTLSLSPRTRCCHARLSFFTVFNHISLPDILHLTHSLPTSLTSRCHNISLKTTPNPFFTVSQTLLSLATPILSSSLHHPSHKSPKLILFDLNRISCSLSLFFSYKTSHSSSPHHTSRHALPSRSPSPHPILRNTSKPVFACSLLLFLSHFFAADRHASPSHASHLPLPFAHPVTLPYHVSPYRNTPNRVFVCLFSVPHASHICCSSSVSLSHSPLKHLTQRDTVLQNIFI